MSFVCDYNIFCAFFSCPNKPAAGVPIGKDVVVCKFPKDPTVSLGATSFVALVISTILGVVSVFYPYQGKHVPQSALFESTSLLVFFLIAM